MYNLNVTDDIDISLVMRMILERYSVCQCCSTICNNFDDFEYGS